MALNAIESKCSLLGRTEFLEDPETPCSGWVGTPLATVPFLNCFEFFKSCDDHATFGSAAKHDNSEI